MPYLMANHLSSILGSGSWCQLPANSHTGKQWRRRLEAQGALHPHGRPGMSFQLPASALAVKGISEINLRIEAFSFSQINKYFKTYKLHISGTFHWIFSFLKLLFFGKAEWQRKRETERCPTLTYSSSGPNGGQDWYKRQPGVQDSIQVSYKGGRGPSPWVISHCFPRQVSTELHWKQSCWSLNQHSHMRFPGL